jgi:hypothetical protein
MRWPCGVAIRSQWQVLKADYSGVGVEAHRRTGAWDVVHGMRLRHRGDGLLGDI